LRDGRINVEEYAIEIRGFCVNFLWVVEAAEVFSRLNSLTIAISKSLGYVTMGLGNDLRMISGVFGHGTLYVERE